MKPILQPDVSLGVIAAIAILNPVVILVAAWLGSRSDQWQKLPVAGFAASIAGIALVWFATWLKLPYITDAARAAGGILVAQMLTGTLWATIAYMVLRRR